MTTTRNSAYDVRMGGGDDEVAVETDRIHRRVNVFDGGDGTDQLGIVIPGKEVRLDLRRERLLAGKTRNAVPAAATGFEDAEVVAGLIELTGTPGDNDLRAHGCDVRVRALGGDDKVSPLTLLHDRPLRCTGTQARFEGGGGDDHLAGDAGPDVLIGGRGRDQAIGGSGRDTCQAERMKRCEVCAADCSPSAAPRPHAAGGRVYLPASRGRSPRHCVLHRRGARGVRARSRAHDRCGESPSRGIR